MRIEEDTAGGDEFTVLYRKYYDDILKYVRHRVRDVQAAEDIVQETFCAAYEKKQVFLAYAQPQLWLFRTAKNKMLEFGRRMRYRQTVPFEDAPEPGREELRYKVKELELTALATLDEQEWRRVRDHYLYGVTIPELASAEGITENNMRVRLSRIKKKLLED